MRKKYVWIQISAIILILTILISLLIVLYVKNLIDENILIYFGGMLGGIFTLLGVLISTAYLRAESKRKTMPIIKYISNKQLTESEKNSKKVLDVVWAPFERKQITKESEPFFNLNLRNYEQNMFSYDLYLQNIGYGPALDLYIEDISETNYHFVSKSDLISVENDLENSSKYYTFSCEDILNEKKYGFKISNRLDSTDTIIIKITYVFTYKINFPGLFVIKFKDIEYNEHYRAFRVICIGENNLQIQELE